MGNTVIQLRNDSEANWASANPILALGEMGLDTDTNKIKFGNGVDHYNDLPYFSSSAFKYGEYGLSADQRTNLAVGNHFEIDTLFNGSLGTLSTGTGQQKGIITLPAGKTYKFQLMYFALYNYQASYLQVQMCNVTDPLNPVLFGMQAESTDGTNPNHCGVQPSLVSFITATEDIDIEVRVIYSNEVNSLDKLTTRLIIEEYGGY